MKKLLMLAIVAGLFPGCRKDDGSKYYQFVPPYSISGLTDLKMQKLNGTTRAYVQLPIAVNYRNGEQERVSLTLENVPQGLFDTLYNATGYPDFNSGLVLIDSGVIAGEYTLKLVAQGERSGRRDYPVKLSVSDSKDCASAAVGNYTKSGYCGSSINASQTVTADPNVRGRIIFVNLDAAGSTIYADIDCEAYYGYQINIPTQTTNGKTFSGSGYVYNTTGNYISEINISLYQNSGNSCNFRLTR